MKPLDPIKEAQAVAALRTSLEALGAGDDEQLLIDSVEGETSFFEAIDKIMEANLEDQAITAAIDEQLSNLRARKERFKKRVETRKALMEQAFVAADLPKVERPLGTLYLSNRAPKVIIETEAEIPTRYWKQGDPVLDQKQLLEDLKSRAAALDAIPAEPGEARDAAIAALEALPAIPGATLSNGLRSLSIRTA